MAQLQKLNENQIKDRLEKCPGWHIQDEKLTCEVKFLDFVEAFGFMSSVALVAERMSHHPEWFNVFNIVRIQLSTHEIGGISDNDFILSSEINKIYSRFNNFSC